MKLVQEYSIFKSMIKTKTQKAQRHVTEHKHGHKAQLGDPPHLSLGLALSSSPNKIKI